ncbi:hypothetical protein M153_11395000506 [Pseudoloma neurophilia]|uniref:Transposable element n=1 Tax=Pseudoloma neurophilia TaxID=146866 RepID=A0A0R0LS78_9MICR|nr:hypothetical protein M153_11395000506 [Pseudoloma neurophilia]
MLLVFKIYKGWNLGIIKLIIENKINRLYNSYLKKSPENILQNGHFKTYQKRNDILSANKNRITHRYSPGDQVLLINFKKKFKTDSNYTGPYKILEVHKNRVKIFDDDNNEILYNIKSIKPYFSLKTKKEGRYRISIRS